MIDLDEALIRPECISHRELGKRIGDNRGGRLIAIEKAGKVAMFGTAATEKQFISEQLLAAIKNRLAAKKDILQVAIRRIGGHIVSLLVLSVCSNLSTTQR